MTNLPEYLPALITPFTARGNLDLKAHTHNLRVLADRGIEGFLIGGSNGEGPYLEPGERGRMIKAGRRRKAHFMAGVTAESTRAGLAQVEECVEAGADTLLVTTPTTLTRNNPEAVLAYFRAVADRARRPVLIYSVPPVMGYSIPIEFVERLARHPNIIGMKDSSGDVVRLQTILDVTPGEFILYSGSSKALTAAIAIGCHGAITGSGNYAPELVLKTQSAAKTEPSRARRHQKRLSEMSAAIESHGVPGVKAAAKAAGLQAGYPRQPLVRVPKGVETSIARLIPNS